MAQADTLIRYLEQQAANRPDACYSRYVFPDRPPVELTFGETLARAREFAALFANRGVGKGDVVLVVLPHHENLMTAFLGAMWIGAIPAFLPSLTAKLDPERYFSTLRSMFERTRPKAIITDRELAQVLTDAPPSAVHSPTIVAMEDVDRESELPEATPHTASDIALLQYSSGSTGLQKGAALSHRAILAEIKGVGEFFEYTDADTFATWVPLHHDWGLVCVALHALELGTSFTLMSPMHWVTRPVTVFELISQHRATVYYHPNFAFRFMARRVKDESMTGIDLSSIRVCCNGAEPCIHADHEAFAGRFEPWGFRRESLSIVYGMAEVTNSVFAAGHKEPIKVDNIDRKALQEQGVAINVPEGAPDSIPMLGVGRPLSGTRFRIVDDSLEEIAERIVGEVEIDSAAAYDGYHLNPEATAKANHDGWYLTGDLGYRVGNTLFITGRKSDLIIVGGVNIYPQDVEAIVAEHPHSVPGRIAAVGVRDDDVGTERLIVTVESRSSEPKVLADIVRYTHREVASQLGVEVSKVYTAPHGWLIKTTSGKIARIPNYNRLSELDEQKQSSRKTAEG